MPLADPERKVGNVECGELPPNLSVKPGTGKLFGTGTFKAEKEEYFWPQLPQIQKIYAEKAHLRPASSCFTDQLRQ
jgi:hypothetical protein